jgi:rhodanese-related sulfurtransferase
VSIPQISPPEAHSLLAEGRGATYVDVRSVPEFAQAHPAGAVNVPLLHADSRGQMAPNPEFLAVMQASFAPDAKLVLGCLSGVRSQRAAELLTEAGYRDVVNVRAGFGGTRNALGRIVEPGWADLGLPVESEAQPGASYESLRGKARI